uniref:Uncharacterized protein n=1 Tax=Tanacetum cinerariifolium TaxID=118510 RepID=A0A6L2NQX4_TANCI|nr:hypothetical protein [Tanacetum cinerariifolium]
MVARGSKGHRHPQSCSRLRKGTVSNNMLMCCEPDTAYGLHLIRRMLDKLALVVEIDFTWSIGFGYVDPEARISLMMFEFSSYLFADSAMSLVSDSSIVCLRSGYEEFSLLDCVYFLVDFLDISSEVIELVLESGPR